MAKAKVKWTGNTTQPEVAEFAIYLGAELVTFEKGDAVEVEAEHVRSLLARGDFEQVEARAAKATDEAASEKGKK